MAPRESSVLETLDLILESQKPIKLKVYDVFFFHVSFISISVTDTQGSWHLSSVLFFTIQHP